MSGTLPAIYADSVPLNSRVTLSLTRQQPTPRSPQADRAAHHKLAHPAKRAVATAALSSLSLERADRVVGQIEVVAAANEEAEGTLARAVV
jgi:hypothetical protein